MNLFEQFRPVTWYIGRITFNGVTVHEARTVWVDGRTYLDTALQGPWGGVSV